MIKKNKKKKEKDSLTKKLEKLCHNYGLDTSDMSDDEFERMKELYKQTGKDVDRDLNESEQYKDKFIDNMY